MFCNYFCGNRKFWSGYFAFCERILESLENEARPAPRRASPMPVRLTIHAMPTR